MEGLNSHHVYAEQLPHILRRRRSLPRLLPGPMPQLEWDLKEGVQSILHSISIWVLYKRYDAQAEMKMLRSEMKLGFRCSMQRRHVCKRHDIMNKCRKDLAENWIPKIKETLNELKNVIRIGNRTYFGTRVRSAFMRLCQERQHAQWLLTWLLEIDDILEMEVDMLRWMELQHVYIYLRLSNYQVNRDGLAYWEDEFALCEADRVRWTESGNPTGRFKCNKCKDRWESWMIQIQRHDNALQQFETCFQSGNRLNGRCICVTQQRNRQRETHILSNC